MATPDAPTILTTNGVRFGIGGGKPGVPAPTLFVFASDLEGTLQNDGFVKAGKILQKKEGFLLVALDMPAHGQDQRKDEPSSLNGWRARLDKDENFVDAFVKKASTVLDTLIKEGYTDPHRVAVAGTSRGGFIALHFAAADSRVKAVVAFAPVTELPVLAEFKGLEIQPLTRSLTAVNLAEKLVGRPIWVCIGNNDERVGTDQCFAFVRKVAQANLAAGKPAHIELHVMPSAGHRTHETAHDEAAAWLAQTMARK